MRQRIISILLATAMITTMMFSGIVAAAEEPVQDQLFFYDGVNAPADTLLGYYGGGKNWHGEWSIQNFNPSEDRYLEGYCVKDENPLLYSDLVSTPTYASGGDSYVRSGRAFIGESGWPTEVEPYVNYDQSRRQLGNPGNILWFSTLVRLEQNTGTDRFFALHDSHIYNLADDKPRTIRVGSLRGSTEAPIDSTKWTLKFGGEVITTDVDIVPGETYFIALKMEFEENGGKVSMFINPELGSIPTNPTAEATIDEPYYFKAFAFYPGSGPDSGALDELRLGTSFNAVAPQREPYKLYGRIFGSAEDDMNELAFDGDPTTWWINGANSGHVGIDLGPGGEKILTRYKWFPTWRETEPWLGDRAQGAIEGSQDGENWDVLDHLATSPTPTGQWYEVELENTTAYRYYRFNGTQWHSTQMADLQFYSGPVHVFKEDFEDSEDGQVPIGWGGAHVVKDGMGVDGSKAMLVTGKFQGCSAPVVLEPGYTYKVSVDVALNETEDDDSGWNGLMTQIIMPYWKIDGDDGYPLETPEISRVAVEGAVDNYTYTSMPTDKSFVTRTFQFVAPAYPEECPAEERNLRIDILNLVEASEIKSAYVDNIVIEKLLDIPPIEVVAEAKPEPRPLLPPDPTNLLDSIDPTFERNSKGVGPFADQLDSTKAHGGERSLVMAPKKWLGAFMEEQLKPNTEYKLSVWVLAPEEGNNVQIGIHYKEPGQGEGEDTFKFISDIESSGEWKEYSMTFTTPEEMVKLDEVNWFSFTLYTDATTINVDDIKFEEIIPPTPEPTAEPTPEPTPEPTEEPQEKTLKKPKVIGGISTDRLVSGKYTENGAIITVYKGTKKLGSGKVAKKGFKFKIKKVAPGDKLKITASKAGFKTSKASNVTVKLQKPTIKVNKKKGIVRGKAYAKAKVKVFLGKKNIGKGKAKANGNFKIKVKSKLKKGTIKVQIIFKKHKANAKLKLKK